MGESIHEMNYIEQLCLEYLMDIYIIIHKLIDNIKNNIPNIIPEERQNIQRSDLSSINEPHWHYYLSNGCYALGGEYPDEESEDHAISYGSSMLNYCVDELYSLPIDLLEDVSIYINDHINIGKCIYCKD